jgi:hypothetical protein
LRSLPRRALKTRLGGSEKSATMTIPTGPDPAPIPKRHAREFITGSTFKTYDAVLAAALSGEKIRKEKGEWKPGDPLVFSGRVGTLASKNGTCESTETNNLKKLVKDGWLILVADQRRVKYHGNFTTNQYRVLTVEEWMATHVYTPKPRKKNDKLRKVNTRRMLGSMGITFDESAWAQGVLDVAVAEYARAAVAKNTSPTVAKNTSPEEPTVAKDTSTTVAKDTSTTVDVKYVAAATKDTSTSLLSLPVVECPPPLPATTAEGGSLSLQKKHLAAIGSYGKRIIELEVLCKEHGVNIVDRALAAIVEQGFEGAMSKVGVTLHRLPEAIAKVEADRAAAVKRKKDEARQDWFIQQQMEHDAVKDAAHDVYAPLFNKRSRELVQSLGRMSLEDWCKVPRRQQQHAVKLAYAVPKRSRQEEEARADYITEEWLADDTIENVMKDEPDPKPGTPEPDPKP